MTLDRGALTKPSVNMEIGQRNLERLRDQPFTGGLLPKVIAAYNAGPMPVTEWNAHASRTAAIRCSTSRASPIGRRAAT